MRSEWRDGVELIEAPDLFWGRGRTGWDPWNLFHRMWVLPRAPFDAIHAFDCRPAVILPALYHAKRAGLPLFVDWADWWGRGGSIQERDGWLVNRLIGGFETWFEEAFRTQAVGTTVISRALQQRAIGLGVDEETILRFPHACDPERTRPQDRDEARRRLGLEAGVPIVVHLGLIYQSDLQLLLDAMRAVVKRHRDVRLVLVGNHRARIPQDIMPPGSLVTPGFVDGPTLHAWLGAANVCVIPLQDTVSARGRWPSKINDYFCAGRAVVVTRVGDAAEWVARSAAGWTSAPEPEPLAEALTGALESPARADEAGARGRRLAETELSAANMAEQLEGFYERRVQAFAAGMTGARSVAALQR